MEIHNGMECFDGFVYADRVRELQRRGIDPAQNPRERFMKPCPICATRSFLRHFGGREMSWANWIDRDDLIDAVETFKNWVPQFENVACLIQSPSELDCEFNGKTHVLCAAGIEFLRAGRRCRYWNAADLAEGRYESWLTTVAEFPFCILIDDLGNEPDNSTNRDAVDRLLDSRYRNRRPTIVSSRLNRATLEKRYPRFMSRMRSGTVINWVADRYTRGMP